MGEDAAEVFYSVTPACPVCSMNLQGQAEPIDMFAERTEEIHYIIDCYGCETRLDLVIDHRYPLCIVIRVTPIDEERG